MTAGRGIQHEENPPAGTHVHTLQLWVNLPAAEKIAVPRYQDLVTSDLPSRSEDGVEIRVFSGAYEDMVSLTLNHHPVTMLEVKIANGGTFRHAFAAIDNAFVYVLEGAVDIGPAGSLLKAGQLGWLTRSEGGRIVGTHHRSAGKIRALSFFRRQAFMRADRVRRPLRHEHAGGNPASVRRLPEWPFLGRCRSSRWQFSRTMCPRADAACL